MSVYMVVLVRVAGNDDLLEEDGVEHSFLGV